MRCSFLSDLVLLLAVCQVDFLAWGSQRLTLWGQNKMATVLHMVFSKTFSWIKNIITQISLKLALKCSTDDRSALVQVMAGTCLIMWSFGVCSSPGHCFSWCWLWLIIYYTPSSKRYWNFNWNFKNSKLFTALGAPREPWAMILMGPRALGMGPIIDVFNHWKFYDAFSRWR